jgi:UDP-glucose 4-epimerase
VHVTDLADAHVRVLDRLEEDPNCRYNVGSGTGYSVREGSDAVQRAAGRDVTYVKRLGRPGDPPVLVASNARIRQETGWTPRYGPLDVTVRTAHDGRAGNPEGYTGIRRRFALAAGHKERLSTGPKPAGPIIAGMT